MHDNDFTCTYTHRQWFCVHDCDDPSHGHHGAPRVYHKGRYYRDGGLISVTNI